MFGQLSRAQGGVAEHHCAGSDAADVRLLREWRRLKMENWRLKIITTWTVARSMVNWRRACISWADTRSWLSENKAELAHALSSVSELELKAQGSGEIIHSRARAYIWLFKGKITRLSRLSRGTVCCEISEISGMFFGFAIYARIIRARITRICIV